MLSKRIEGGHRLAPIYIRGVCCRATCRHGTPSIAGLLSSATKVASKRSIMPWSCSIANGSDDKPVLRARSSTPRASRPPRLVGRAATTRAPQLFAANAHKRINSALARRSNSFWLRSWPRSTHEMAEKQRPGAVTNFSRQKISLCLERLLCVRKRTSLDCVCWSAEGQERS